MLVGEVGEFRLIETLAEAIAEENEALIDEVSRRGFRLRVSIGDDAAAWDMTSGSQILTTDTMVEGVHFSLDYTGWADLGWKSLAVNLSDVAAMGCVPLYSVVTLGLRDDLPVEGLVDMYRGVMELSRRCGGAIAGGDVVRSPVFFVTFAMMGFSPTAAGVDRERTIMTRDAARLGDQIAVTGSLGCSAAGLRLLASDRLGHLAADIADHLRAAHSRPVPRVAEGVALASEGVMAAIDVSDGLVADLGHLCQASGVGAVVRAESIPADAYVRGADPEDWLALALGGGEDYELLFAAPAEVVERAAATIDLPISVIGEIVEGRAEVRVVDAGGRPVNVDSTGWDHLRPARRQG